MPRQSILCLQARVCYLTRRHGFLLPASRKEMKLPHPLAPGRLLRRYKRFLADVELCDGMVFTAHCPNSGSMLGCDAPGSPVLLSRSDNPSRKFPYTWELARADACWVG